MPVADSPEEDPHNYFDGYWRCGRADDCGQAAGWGTDHTGVGACKLHGGRTPTGEDSPHFEHGLFSDYLGEEDRAAIDALDEYGDVEKLDELINWRLARLRRAVRALNEGADERTFWEAFEEIVNQAGPVGEEEIRELARMLDKGNRAMQQEIDLVRKLIKDRNKIAEGESHEVGLRDLFGGDG
ncbi:hypothetical protein BRC81_03020 [Halobacteriales archaeon QS_1_68_20]|nr:MAG: hypothetical protein BRC81_03020 [Halobacteriales archaeon QS_1_68_20]